MFECFACMCASALVCAMSLLGSQVLELKMVISHYMGAENKNQVPSERSSILN